MRRISNKRRKLTEEVGPLRRQYLRENPICQRPGCNSAADGCIHEFARGNRERAFADPCVWLSLCREDHLLTVHAKPLEFPFARQCAWKVLADPRNFCLSRALALDGKDNANVAAYFLEVAGWLEKEL